MTDLDSVTNKETEKAKKNTTKKTKNKTTTKKEELQNEPTEISKGTDLRDGSDAGQLLPEPSRLHGTGNSESRVERNDSSTEEKESDQKEASEESGSQEVGKEENSKEEVVTPTTSLSTTPKSKKRKVNKLTPAELARWRGMPWPVPIK